MAGTYGGDRVLAAPKVKPKILRWDKILDTLAAEFKAHDYILKLLASTAICTSRRSMPSTFSSIRCKDWYCSCAAFAALGSLLSEARSWTPKFDASPARPKAGVAELGKSRPLPSRRSSRLPSFRSQKKTNPQLTWHSRKDFLQAIHDRRKLALGGVQKSQAIQSERGTNSGEHVTFSEFFRRER